MARGTGHFLDRLKVLPLTILLTVLLWLYADSHLTSTESDLPIHIAVLASPAAPGNRTVRIINPKDGAFQIAIQGPRNRVQRVREQCNGRAVFTPQDVNDLVYMIPHAGRLRIGENNYLNALRVFNSLPYFRQRRINVISVKPARIRLRVDEMVTVRRPILFRALGGVPVKISPATARISLPRSLLTSIGGVSQLRVIARPLRDLSALAPNRSHTIAAQLVAQYPGPTSSQVGVSPTTSQVTLTIPPQPRGKLFIGIVPVWVGGPARLLDRYSITVRPGTLRITVMGSRRRLARLRRFLVKGGAALLRQRVTALLAVSSSWIPTTGWVRRRLDYELPRGVRLLAGPRHVLCRVRRRNRRGAPAASQPVSPASRPAEGGAAAGSLERFKQ